MSSQSTLFEALAFKQPLLTFDHALLTKLKVEAMEGLGANGDLLTALGGGDFGREGGGGGMSSH